MKNTGPMNRIIILIALIILASACAQAETKDHQIPQEQLSKMKSRDFKSHVSVVVHDGNLKGEYLFEKNADINKQMMSVSIRHEYGPGYKDDVVKNMSIMALGLPQTGGDLELKLFELGFDGIIKNGDFAVRSRKRGGKNPLRFLNENQEGKWSKAQGELQANNQIQLTHVGPWLKIKNKKEVRRIEGTFTDDVKFEYFGAKQNPAKETVSVTVTFSGMQVYSPMMNGK